MDTLINDITLNLDYFLLVLIRVSALIVTSPIFGRRNIPNQYKIGFCVIMAVVLYLVIDKQEVQYYGFVDFGMLVIKELLFGLVLGYITTLFFAVVQTAGFIMDRMMAFGMVSVFDPQSNTKMPITGNLLYIVLTIMFFRMNAHHQLIYILHSTFEHIPIGQVVLSPQLAFIALEVFILAFIMSVNVAMPLIASGLLGEIVLGFTARMVPQMNVFVVGMPLKVMLGFLMIYFIMPIYVGFTDNIIMEMFESLDKMFRMLGGV